MQQHLIFGAGLIGGFMAGCFKANGLDVSVLARESMRARYASELSLTDYHEHKQVVSGINFIASGETSEQEFDFIWLTVKCTGLDQALLDLVPFVSSNSVILSCQNGLGSDALVQAAFPNNEVRRVIMTSNIAQPSDTHLHRGSQGDLLVEEYILSNGRTLAEVVSSSLLVAKSIKDIEAFSWAKLQLNLGNAVNALANVPVKEMLEHRGYRRIIALAMEELIVVASARGLTLPKLAAIPMRLVPKVLNTPNFLFSILGSKMMDIDPSVRTSMWWDLHNQRLTEIDSLSGAVVEEGLKMGISCRVNQKIVETIHTHEKGFGSERIPFSAEVFLSELDLS